MFTQPTPPSPGLFPPLTPSTTAPPASPSSPGRGSRLRGLIHLHLLSRDTSSLVHHNRTVPQDTSISAPSIQPASPTTTSAVPHEVDSDPLNPADPNDDSSRTHRRRASRFSEAASEALLNSRSESNHLVENQEHSLNANMTRTRSATTSDVAHDVLPTIRFSAFFDTRSNRPSLSFTPISRTLPTGKETIKVGRYSERENHALVPINTPSAAPVGFKSKVVSRRHCEFWFEKGKWYIKDVKSSSGTFLNHIRLSAPGTESKPFPINDGDIVQLGIDFKGGEEMIYRCVKMRIELNRGWQSKPNTFNMATHKRLRDLTSTSASSAHAQDCSICLNAIAPCQSLFVAPCSHTWHFKCIREMLNGPSWPIFICPNCRATADLDAEVDEPSDEWQQLDSGIDDAQEEKTTPPASQLNGEAIPLAISQSNVEVNSRQSSGEGDAGDVTMQIDAAAAQSVLLRHAVTEPVPIPNATPRVSSGDRSTTNRTPSPNSNPPGPGHEGPITPRNDAGPWVFDGNPARASQESTRRPGMSSLDAAAQVEVDRS
ncbi:E3 ubiquitin-protein ligase DMA2 [Daldinia childiae]|uniref:E3 ubiquitin-protein ligase DMA2 n=1 Tax=Daldinia childiae TaxID=326645 RepID=UPI001445C529|nr:E3 ubiquitin-protein ligase DMA2 [Daldinia childiae]KAF3059617.1 E3 ubiquitin-protein ligase DMA2 [Daldinia childiae]